MGSKTMIKKFFQVSAILSLTSAVLLAGCQNKEAQQATTESSPTQQKALEPVNLKYYFFGVSKPGDQEVYDGINKMLKEKINTTVEFIKVPNGDYTQKMSVMVNAREEFDLAFTSPAYLNYFDQAAKGSFVDISTLLPKYAPETYKLLKPAIWDAAKVNGKIYASINQQIFARQSGFNVNKALADKYNFNPKSVKKLSDLIPYLDNVKAGESAEKTDQLYNAQIKNNVFNYFFPSYEWESIGGSDVPGAAKSLDSNPKVFNEYDTPEFKDFIMTLKDFQKKGLIAKDSLTRPTFDATKYMAAPIATLMPGIEETVKNTHKADQYIIPLGDPILTSPNAIATMTAISTTSKHPERALMVIELLNTDKDLYNLLVWGTEGVDYKKIGDKRIEPLPGAKYGPAYGWMFGNQFNAYISGTQPDDVWEKTKALNESAKVSTLYGFSFNVDSIKAESANSAAIVNEYRAAFNTGMFGDDTEKKYNEFLAKLKTAGIDKVLAEKQKQVDAFIASKK